MSGMNENGGGIMGAIKGFTTPAPAKNGNKRQLPKATELRTDAPLELKEDDIDTTVRGGDMYDEALRAMARVFRHRLLAGTGEDRSVEVQFFAPNSLNRKRLYALLADYGAAELMSHSERFGGNVNATTGSK